MLPLGQQKDTLRTIAACLPVYGVDNALAFSSEIWEALKVEVSIGSFPTARLLGLED